MIKDIKSTSKHTAIYAFGSIATKIVGLVLIPLYTNTQYLSHSDFGVLAVLEATAQLLVGLLTMAMVNSLTRWYWDAKYVDQQKSIFFTTMAFLGITIIPIAIVLSLLSGYFSSLLFQSIDYTYLLQLTIFTSVLQVLNNQVLCLAKVRSRSDIYTIVNITKLVLVLGLILYGVLYKKQGLVAVWQANIIGEAVIFLFLLPYTYRNSVFKFQARVLKEMLSYGMPLMLASLSGVLLIVTDRYMLSSMSGLEVTGVYSLGYRIANTLKMVISVSLGLSLAPLQMKKMNEPNNQRFYAKILTYSGYIFIVGLLLLSLFSLEGLKIFTGSVSYWDANGIVPIISFALFFGLLKDLATVALTIKKKTKILGLLIFLTWMLNIVFNFVLIPFFDSYGAALATLLAQLFFFFAVCYHAQKAYFIPYEWKKIIVMVFVASLYVIIGIAVGDLSIYIRILIKLALLFSFPFVLYFFNFYEEVEKDYIAKLAEEWKSPSKFIQNMKRLLK